jgi:hypothetical protein
VGRYHEDAGLQRPVSAIRCISQAEIAFAGHGHADKYSHKSLNWKLNFRYFEAAPRLRQINQLMHRQLRCPLAQKW